MDASGKGQAGKCNDALGKTLGVISTRSGFGEKSGQEWPFWSQWMFARTDAAEFCNAAIRDDRKNIC
jgi:hypothetical protein